MAALAGPLTIGTGVGTSAEVRVSSANAIANSPPVTIATSLANRSGTLNIGVKNVRVGTLRMIGGQVVGSIGQLQLNGDLIAEGLPVWRLAIRLTHESCWDPASGRSTSSARRPL